MALSLQSMCVYLQCNVTSFRSFLLFGGWRGGNLGPYYFICRRVRNDREAVVGEEIGLGSGTLNRAECFDDVVGSVRVEEANRAVGHDDVSAAMAFVGNR